MGILNLTPDSFFDGGQFVDQDKAKDQVEKMISDGAHIIDVGAVSTRPGSTAPSIEEELKRLLPIISFINQKYPDVFISVDTYNASVLESAFDLGAHIANDISAGCIDEDLWKTVKRLNMPYVLMHMQGTPQTMQTAPSYENVIKEILTFFVDKLHELKLLGIEDVILDPGFGFGKTIEHNYKLLKHLGSFRFLEKPLLAGTSNKSMIYKGLDIDKTEIISANSILYYEALTNGAKLLRVHNVAEAVEAVKIFSLLDNN